MIEDLISSVRAIAPMLRAQAFEGEREGTLTSAVDQALRENNLLTLLLPRRWGGSGLSLTDYGRVQMELARGDLSACWVSQVVNSSCWIASTSSDACQEALFGAGPKLVCGAISPLGSAKEVEGGYIVEGAWNYASGSRQADWTFVAVVFTDRNGTTLPGMGYAFIPMAEVTIEDSWYVTGLQGTGSDTIVAKKVFVAPERALIPTRSFGTRYPMMKHFGAPSDYIPYGPGARAAGLAQLVGGAQVMLEMIEAVSKTTGIHTTVFPTKADSSVVLHNIGKAATQIETARVALFELLGTLDRIGQTKAEFSNQERTRQKAQCGFIVELIHTAIESIMFIGGSSAFSHANPLSRYWRDTHMALRHAVNLPYVAYEVNGRDRLQLPNIVPPGWY